ncbi:LysE family transporter [Streptomyces sp. NPDC059385]|uniref:LysE family transporter n=1 Tax=Streptomyces sp. NPDC059385 TaxID=3346817 RepID=UPI0036C49D2A
MTELLSPALGGAAAGLGVAMPMGAMSVLLLQEAMRHRRTAIAAAAGIAAVDLAYAALATGLGPWVAFHIAPVEAWVRLASALILLAIAAHGLRTGWAAPAAPPPAIPPPPPIESRGPGNPAPPAIESRVPETAAPPPIESRGPGNPAPPAFEERGPGRSPGSQAPPAPSGPAPAAPAQPAIADRGQARHARAGTGATPPPRAAKAFARYVALTAVNPTTALYFAALTTAQGASLSTGAAGAAFLVGVGAASLLWQQTLVAVGALAGARVSDTARVWTFRLGYGLVAAYALKIAFPLPTPG